MPFPLIPIVTGGALALTALLWGPPASAGGNVAPTPTPTPRPTPANPSGAPQTQADRTPLEEQENLARMAGFPSVIGQRGGGGGHGGGGGGFHGGGGGGFRGGGGGIRTVSFNGGGFNRGRFFNGGGFGFPFGYYGYPYNYGYGYGYTQPYVSAWNAYQLAVRANQPADVKHALYVRYATLSLQAGVVPYAEQA